jgi:hypothetical protein
MERACERWCTSRVRRWTCLPFRDRKGFVPWGAVVAAVCFVGACDGADRRESVSPTAMSPMEAELDCINGYTETGPLPADHAIVLGAVALPTARALQTARTGLTSDARLWAKDGLFVSTDAAVELRVPDEWRGKLSFIWGQPADRHLERIRIPACATTRGASTWLAFTGGYFVADPACVAIIVTVGQAQQRVQIGVGAPCAGQDPPASPSDS